MTGGGEGGLVAGSGFDRLVGGDGGGVEDLADAAVHGDELDGVGEADEEGADLNATISDTFDAGQRPVRAPRIFFPTDQERERHRAFVAGLTDPIWQLGEKEVAPL